MGKSVTGGTGGTLSRQAVLALLLLAAFVLAQPAQYAFALACETSPREINPAVRASMLPPEAACERGNLPEHARHCASVDGAMDESAGFAGSGTYSCSGHFCCALPSFSSPVFCLDSALTPSFGFVGIPDNEIPPAAPRKSLFRPPRV
jgi:hypothetical protein